MCASVPSAVLPVFSLDRWQRLHFSTSMELIAAAGFHILAKRPEHQAEAGMLSGMIRKPRKSAASILTSAFFLLTLLNCFSGIIASAATIYVSQSRNDSKQIIMSGELVPEDLDRFLAASANARNAVVRFNSRGGHLQTGLAIGLIIRQRGYTTAVGAGSLCYSSCALAWLAGRIRLKDVTSRVGFHAASDANHTYSPEGTEMMRAMPEAWDSARRQPNC